jgi:protein disulfide-isomerase
MKKLLFITLLISSTLFYAQEITWHTDFDKAAKISKKTNKPILGFFTGSDWCGWCKVLDKEVLKTDKFKKWAKENVVLLELDFPRKTKISKDQKVQNYALQKAFGVSGYPTLVLFQPGKDNPKKNLKELGRTGYVSGGPNKWIKSIDKYVPKS